MVGPLTINDIMTEDVITVELEQTVQEAIDIMERERLRKIIVIKDNEPRYILEDWKAWRLAKDKKIANFEEQLRWVERVQSYTSIENVRMQLEQEPAIIVTQDDKMIGVATATDLTKISPRTRQWNARVD